MRELAKRLDSARDPPLTEIAQGVADALALPYAQIAPAAEFRLSGGEWGRRGGDETSFPLIDRGRRIGTLTVCARTIGTPLAADEQRLLSPPSPWIASR